MQVGLLTRMPAQHNPGVIPDAAIALGQQHALACTDMWQLRALPAAQHGTAYVGYSVHSAEAGAHPFFSSRSSSSSCGTFQGSSPRGGGPPGGPPAHARSHSMASTGGTGAAGASPRGVGAGGAADASAHAASCPNPNPKPALDLHACPPPAARPAGDARNGGPNPKPGPQGSPRGAGAPGGGKGLGEGGEAAPAPGAAAQEAGSGGGNGAGDMGDDVRLITCTPDATLRKARPHDEALEQCWMMTLLHSVGIRPAPSSGLRQVGEHHLGA